MSKIGAKVKGFRKKAVPKVYHGSTMKTYIPSGMASAGPPLGPMLGQYGINIANFCKDFNEKTKHMKEGIPLPCQVTVNPDRSHQLVINKPPSAFYLKQAAGIVKGAMKGGGEVVGKVTLKHIYEIAKIKSEDRSTGLFDLQTLCKLMVGTARACGIEVVRELDPVEYQQFLEEQKIIIEQYKQELLELKESKMLRTA